MNYLPILLFLVVTAAPVLMNGPANPSSWSSSSAWSPASTSLRGLPAGTLQAWYDANNIANKVAFINFSLTASGAAGGNVLITSQNANAYLIVGAQLQLGNDANVYQITSVSNSNLTVQPNLKSTYNNALLQVASVLSVVDRSGNGRHLYSNSALNVLSPIMVVYEQVGYTAVSYYPGWANGQMLAGWADSSSGAYASVNGPFAVGAFIEPASTIGPWIGPTAEIAVFNMALNTNQRQQLEGYMAWRWGLQSYLPAAHPYATAAPIGFTPASLSPNLMQWYDANSPTTLFSDSGCSTPAVSGNTIGCWLDKSGNNQNLLQTNSNYRPTYSITALGGSLPAINATFRGSYTLFTSSNANWLSNTNYTIAAVNQLGGYVAGNWSDTISAQNASGTKNCGVAIGWNTFSDTTALSLDQVNSAYSYNIAGAPLYNPSSQNGLPGLSYVNNANQSSFSMDGNTASYLNNIPYAVAVVAQATFLQAQELVGTSYPINGLVNNSTLYFFWNNINLMTLSQQGPNSFSLPESMTTQPTLYVVGSLSPNKTFFYRINGSFFTGTNASSYFTAVSGYFSLGQFNQAQIGLTGNIYETIVLTGNLKTAHLTMLEGYLAWKWGLQTQLPRNHPYRLVPPRK